VLVEVIVGGLVVAAWHKARGAATITPEEEEMFVGAMEHLQDIPKLRTLADAFEKKRLPIYANLLRKRAELRAATPEVKAQRKAALEKGLASTDPKAVEILANAFEKLTATAAAKKLREHATALRQNSITRSPSQDPRSRDVSNTERPTVMTPVPQEEPQETVEHQDTLPPPVNEEIAEEAVAEVITSPKRRNGALRAG
jgi:hypothetical protein